MFTELSPTIVVIDDEPSMRKAITQVLAPHGYQVRAVASAEAGLEVLRHERAACLILDLHLQGRSGLDALPEIAEVDPNLAVVVLTGDRQAASARACMHGGVMDYLTKPFEPAALVGAVQRALDERVARLDRVEMRRWLQEELAERSALAAVERRKLEQLAAASLEVLVTALEAKDRFMAGHSLRVADLAASIGAELGLPDDEVEQVRQAGRLHDLGMIGISDRILSKEGPLTAEEVAEIRLHPGKGDQLLKMHPELEVVAGYVRSHHERWDGQGYPDHLSGAEIPLGGRILAASEVYDALVSDRAYRHSRMTPEEACRHIATLAGAALDPSVCRALAMVVGRRQALEFVVEEGPTRREGSEARGSNTALPGGRAMTGVS